MTPWHQAEIAVRGIWVAAIAALVLIVCAFGAVQTVRLEGLKVWPIEIVGWIETAKTNETQRDAERTAHRATKVEMAEAEKEAARLEAERLKRVREQQEEITNAIESDYRGQLADLGARAERLRAQLRARTGSASAAAGERGTPLRNTSVRTDAAAGDDRLPSARAEPALVGPLGRTADEQLERDIIATRQALQLDALIDWVEQQTTIDPNAGPD
jgi:hypothetical protein